MKNSLNDIVDKSLKPADKSESVVFRNALLEKDVKLFFTKDPFLLQQYYKLREEIYKKDLGFDKYDGRECEYDRRGEILLAVFNGEVVGGARLNFSDRHEYLCNEQPEGGIIYKDLLRKYMSDFSEGDSYVEICTLVERSDFRGGQLLSRIYEKLVSYAAEAGYKYIVGDSYSKLCRLYERFYKKNGYDAKILYDMPHNYKESYSSKHYSIGSNRISFPIVGRSKRIQSALLTH